MRSFAGRVACLGHLLSRDLQRHADLHRALGFKFRTQHALLRLFVSYAESCGDEFVCSGRVIHWAAQASSAAQCRNRLLTVRRFALALRAEDARHEAPPADAFGSPGTRRRKPYIYAPEEVARLLAAAARLGPVGSLRASTYETLFGLLAATGMRISEALALQVADAMADGLLIRATKFQKRCPARAAHRLRGENRCGVERHVVLGDTPSGGRVEADSG